MVTTTYSADDDSTTMQVGWKVVDQGATFDQTIWRSFMKFTIEDPPFTLGEIDSVVMELRCTSLTDDGTVRLRSATAGTWTIPLTGTQMEMGIDYDSTNTNIEDDVSITGVGTYEFTINKNNLNLDGTTSFKLTYLNEGGENLIKFASEENTTGAGAFKPKIIITYTPGAGGTQMQMNIGDSWKDLAAMQINIGDTWKAVEGAQVNIGDAWKTIF